MKILVGLDTGTYTFAPLTKQITITGVRSGGLTLTTINLEQILLVTNVTDNIMLYNFADATLGATILGTVLTVNYDTSLMSSNDKLMILMEIQDPTEDLLRLLNRLVKISESSGTVDSSNRQRVIVDAFGAALSMSTLTTLTTITNPVPVGNIATIGGKDPANNYADTSRIAYEMGIRSKITFY
jgi:hypothetical protein